MSNELQAKANQAVASVGETKLSTAAAKLTDFYMSDVVNLNEAVGVPISDESRRCATNALIQLCADIGAENVKNLPKQQILKVLQFVTINQLDVFSGQVFIDKRKGKDGSYVSVNATPMGNAYEIMTSRFGVNVKTVHPARIVHEGDELVLPQYEGLTATPLKHKTTLKGLDGKAIAIYYIIEKTDGTLEYAISTREQVANNLKAQILNASLRDANANRGELMKKLEGMSLDDILCDDSLAVWVSPAYRSPASREQMIITKMKKNALLHYTRDLGNKNPVAYEKVNSDIDRNDDMVVSTEVEESKDKTPTMKISDFTVEDTEVSEPKAKKAEEEAKPVEVEVADTPKSEVKEAPKPEPKPETKEEPKAEPETVSIFSTEGL